MVERISKLLSIKDLSASKFADEVGVQRSSISHILSGRNKPSLEFILKILDKYPDINPDWLLKGKGEVFRGETDLFTNISEKKIENTPKSRSDLKNENEPEKTKNGYSGEEQAEKAPIPGTYNGQAGTGEIEKIIIFYRNRKFKVYFPGN